MKCYHEGGIGDAVGDGNGVAVVAGGDSVSVGGGIDGGGSVGGGAYGVSGVVDCVSGDGGRR